MKMEVYYVGKLVSNKISGNIFSYKYHMTMLMVLKIQNMWINKKGIKNQNRNTFQEKNRHFNKTCRHMFCQCHIFLLIWKTKILLLVK